MHYIFMDQRSSTLVVNISRSFCCYFIRYIISLCLTDIVIKMNRKILLAVVAGVAVGFLALYIAKKRNLLDRFISTTYGVSCAQLCSIAHPNVSNACNNLEYTVECKAYDQCIDDCRADQENLRQETSDSSIHRWDGPYGKLL